MIGFYVKSASLNYTEKIWLIIFDICWFFFFQFSNGLYVSVKFNVNSAVLDISNETSGK